MGVVFPLSIYGKIILVLIAIVLGLIYLALAHPVKARRIFGKLFGKRQLLKESEEDEDENP